MAMLKNRKRDYYALKHDLRDEVCAPEHLDSAGDLLIKDLAEKQRKKSITLEEQLKIHQNFEKGSELKPWIQSGLSTLDTFQKTSTSLMREDAEEEEEEKASISENVIQYNMETIKNRSGLTRHELELVMAEKPGSQSSILYKFALCNRKGKKETEEDLVSKLSRHPLNRLKEIEEEMFGEKKLEEEEDEEEGKKKKKKQQTRRRRKRRRRIKNRKEIKETEEEKKEEESESSEEEEEVTSYRPSLWDVKDMRKFCRNEQQGCEIQKLYTIRDGKIVQINPKEG